jgi:hypothetical protein
MPFKYSNALSSQVSVRLAKRRFESPETRSGERLAMHPQPRTEKKQEPRSLDCQARRLRYECFKDSTFTAEAGGLKLKRSGPEIRKAGSREIHRCARAPAHGGACAKGSRPAVAFAEMGAASSCTACCLASAEIENSNALSSRVHHAVGDGTLKLTNEADENSTGPASFMLVDLDGNPVLIDQHL